MCLSPRKGFLVVLALSCFDDFKIPVSERDQTTSTTESSERPSNVVIRHDIEMSWKQFRRESTITQVRQSNDLLESDRANYRLPQSLA